MANRTVHHGDGVAHLRAASLGEDVAIVTSLPDSSELPRLDFLGWREWFSDVARLACAVVHETAPVLFFQTDVKRDGVWVDKAYLVQAGADRAGSALLFHKIVCRAPAGTTTFGRPAYAHLLGFSRALRLAPSQSSADVLPTLGKMPWPRAMGVDACRATCRFLLEHTRCRTVLDPFCGIGTLLAVANAHGLDAIGVELSRKRAEKARALELPESAG
ncbi:MAG TPA: hypothetical protein VHE30_06655 [Polyangiaceae bacterium]|nr:hypothetical protein [Polyangiaceae bacterium]